jgi:hypothetical protein
MAHIVDYEIWKNFVGYSARIKLGGGWKERILGQTGWCGWRGFNTLQEAEAYIAETKARLEYVPERIK